MNLKTAIKSLACAAAALLAGGCEKKSAELNLYGWDEYIPKSVLDGYTKKTGIKVNYEIFSTNEEMIAKLKEKPKHYDLVQPSEFVIEDMRKAKLLLALDKKLIPNLKNIAPEFRDPAFDKGNVFTVPYLAGSVGILIDTEKVREPIRSFADVFSGKYAGRIVVLDDSRELLACWLSSQGKSINQVDAKTIAAAKPVLAEWMKQVAVFDSDSPKDAFKDGKADIGIVWAGEAATMCAESRKYDYVLPKSGAHRFVDSLAIPHDAPHKDAAYAFINYVLRPDVSAAISDEFPYTNPNAEARKFLRASQLNNPASFPGPAKLDSFVSVGGLQAAIDEMWEAVKPAQPEEKKDEEPKTASAETK